MNPFLLLGVDFLAVLIFAVGYFALCWLIAWKLNNWSIVDVAWSYGFAVVGLWLLCVHLWGYRLDKQCLLMIAATMLWSLRLGTHLAYRVLGHLDREDGRYLKMRAEWGADTPRKMAGFYFLQAVALTLLCLPLLSTFSLEGEGPVLPIHLGGLGVIAAAMLGEALADAQLAAFKKNPANKGQVCAHGLWAWTRHPNYFCEWLIWVGFALLSYNEIFYGLPGLACAAIMYHLLTKVTGVPLTEVQLLASKGEAYAAYQRQVPAFWPRPPRA